MLKKIFSVKNQGFHKVVTILGIKLKIKSSKLLKKQGIPCITFWEKIFSIKNDNNKTHKIIRFFGIKFKYFYKKVNFPKGTKPCAYKNIKKNIKRLAIFASYTNDGIIHEYVVYYLKELHKRYDGIIFITDNPIYPKELDKIKKYVIYAKCKRHQEYDFGSYKYGYNFAVANNLLNNVDELLLCNDSVYGPIYPLEKIYKKMEKENCDFWGMIESPDCTYHLQSWFLLFKSNIIKSGYLGKFLNKVKKERDFWDVVNNYEMKLTTFLIKKGFKNGAYIKAHNNETIENSYKTGINNITLNSAYKLIKHLDFPFVKIKVFINSPNDVIIDNKNNIMNYIKHKNKDLYNIIKENFKHRNYTLKETPNVYNAILENDIISFDIFDTLLIRPYLNPTDLFLHMEHFYNIPNFAKERIKAEECARIKASNYEDITFNEIYDCILPKYQQYKEKELYFEALTLRKHPENYELYKFAKDNHKKIIITSDMYLPKDFLEKVLQQNGYDEIDKIYVSSEYKKTKATGTLYQQILKDYNISENNLSILHIGDNIFSDIKNAKENSFSTLYTEKYSDKFFSLLGNVKYKQFSANLELSKSIITSMIAQHELYKFNSYWKEIGYALGGPFAVGYINMIIKESKANNIDSLLFVARDGYILQKVYNILVQNPLENNYIYAPRILNLKCFGDWNNDYSYLQRYIKILSENISEINCYDKKEDIINEISRHQEKISKWIENNKNEYLKYIKSLNIKGKRLASVDMTTARFTSSSFLKKIFSDRFILGYYSGTFLYNPSVDYITYSKNKYDAQQTPLLKLSELLITSPEPPICDIKNELPVYQECNDRESCRISIIKQIQEGILEFATDYKDLFNKIPFDITIETNLELLTAYVKHLNLLDKSFLNEVYHAGDVLNKNYESLLKDFEMVQNKIK